MEPELAEFVRDSLIKKLSDEDTSFYEIQAQTPTGNAVSVALNISEGIATDSTYGRKTERAHQAEIEVYGKNHVWVRIATRRIMSELRAFAGQSTVDARGTNFQIVLVNITRQNYSRDTNQDYETSTINATFTIAVRG